MEVYVGDSFTILVDGNPVDCLSTLSLSDSSDLVQFYTGEVEWRKVDINLQGYQISLDGFGATAYTTLLAFKRNKTQVQWSYSTSQGGLIASGNAFITNISRSYSPSEDDAFNVQLLGLLNPT